MKFIDKAKKFLEPMGASKKYLFLSILKFAVWAIYALYAVFLLKSATQAIEAWNMVNFTSVLWFFIAFVIGYFLFSILARRWDWPIFQYIVQEWISDNYARKVMLLDNNYLESIGTGKMISIFTTGMRRWVELLQFWLHQTIRVGIVFVVTLYTIFSMSSLFGVVFIIFMIVVHLLVVWIDGYARKYRKYRTEKNQEYSRKIVQIIMSKMEILQNNLLDARSRELTAINAEISKANDGVNTSLFWLFMVPRMTIAIVRIVIMVIVGFGVFHETYTLTDFTLIMALIILFDTFLMDSVDFFKNFTKEFSDIESFWNAIDNAPIISWYDTGKKFKKSASDIVLENISYSYNTTPVFDNFSLTLKEWKKTALVGASGGWKTTLMKIIAGYLHPDSGAVNVFGNVISDTALNTYYPHIGYLSQDPSVFDGTIRDNLISAISTNTSYEKMSKNSLDALLKNALIKAQCHFVFEMENGLETEIGERGIRLSGWQKQRLAIAKIFLKDPDIILLDEPTSALDSFSEEKITLALNELFHERTVIIIAHRLQTVKKSDEIIVIEWGKIQERWAHEELSSLGGKYAKMLELQSGF